MNIHILYFFDNFNKLYSLLTAHPTVSILFYYAGTDNLANNCLWAYWL